MPMPMKPTPLRYCTACGEKLERKTLPPKKRTSRKTGKVTYVSNVESLLHFSRRKYCSRECMSAGFSGVRRGDSQNVRTSRMWARQDGLTDSCADCGKQEKLDVHHIDENPLNNAPENLVSLCRSCHLQRHRQERLCEIAGCGRKHKGHGLCDMHLQRSRRAASH